MNFIEAVQNLSKGLCEGFRREMWQRGTFLEIGNSASEPLIFNCGTAYIPYLPYLCDFIADDYELVNPKPQTETVEVKRWVNIYEDPKKKALLHWTKREADEAEAGRIDCVEITVPYQREVKKEVTCCKECGHKL